MRLSSNFVALGVLERNAIARRYAGGGRRADPRDDEPVPERCRGGGRATASLSGSRAWDYLLVDIDVVAAEFEAGMLPPESMSLVAAKLLEEGWDAPALRLAAGAEHEDSVEQRARFRLALEQLGELPLASEEVAARLTTLWAERVLRDDVEPLAAARVLWLLSREYGVQFSDDSFWGWGTLDPDEYAAPGVREAYERDIRETALRWMATHEKK